MAEEQQPSFAVQRMYLKDVSFEAPNAPGIFLEEWKPEINIQMDNSVQAIDEAGVYDVQLRVNVEAKVGEKTAYIAEVVQGGIFMITGFPEEDRTRLTGAVCPETLYPYAREAISNIISKASFPPFLLTPVNFDYLYQKRLDEQQAAQADNSAA